MKSYKKQADICLVLEGTYPYVRGGVSTWVHELIESQTHLKFHLLTILAPDGSTKMLYKMPKNVVSVNNVFLQKMPKGEKLPSLKVEKELFNKIETPLLNLQTHASLKQLKKLLTAFEETKRDLGEDVLLNSDSAWRMLVRMYNSSMGNTSFLDYFWSWRALLGGLFSVTLAPIPNAKLYHGLCTGYAGLFLSRVYVQTGKPCMITEHGIYTNERRIEISSADWLGDEKSLDFTIDKGYTDRDLRDFWIDSFTGYSKLAYEACDRIITLYEGNKKFQLEDGAEADKLSVIPNGIDFERFSSVKRDKKHPPTIALIGRVVPIKDIKTYIRACAKLKEKIPNLVAYIMGPTEESELYYEECLDMVNHMNLKKTVIFTGMVNIMEYLPKIDIQVLTSISEAQPLVILEAGASGIPSVTTNVGACWEMIYGRSDESPELGAAGAVCPLSNPNAIAKELEKLLLDKEYYAQCSRAIKERVRKYYNKEELNEAYYNIYEELINKSPQ